MKAFTYNTEGHYRPSSKGKGFPRHLYKKIDLAIDEDSAQDISYSYGYSGNRYIGEPIKMSMNRSYANMAEYEHTNKPYPKHSHLMRWFKERVGQDADKVYSEFVEAFKLQPALKESWHDAKYWFDDYIYQGGHTKHFAYGEKKFYPYMTDEQNRIQKNPEYRTYREPKKKLYDSMFVRDNRPILEEIQAKLEKEHSNGFWMKGGDAVGPIGISKQLWIVHPVTKMPIKAPVSLIRTKALEGSDTKEQRRNYWSASEVPLTQQLNADKKAWLSREFTPVGVIWDAYSTHGVIRVDCKKWPNQTYSSDFKEWTFVVPKIYAQ